MAKIPEEFEFYDLSDYARPFGNWVVQRIINTPINSIHVTIAFIFVGIIASYLYTVDSYVYTVIAGFLLLLKSGLDAADGALARAQNRPSKVGRFLDSIGDFFVNVFVVIGIVTTMNLSGINSILFAGAVLFSITWQGSIYNYFYVTYRWQHEGDKTSSTDESKLDENLAPWDNIHVLRVLHKMYLIIYAWQDSWIAALERLNGTSERPITKSVMRWTSIMGLGAQLLIIWTFSLINQPAWSLYLFLTFFNLYWIAIFIYRRYSVAE